MTLITKVIVIHCLKRVFATKGLNDNQFKSDFNRDMELNINLPKNSFTMFFILGFIEPFAANLIIKILINSK